ncbi:hypothetical protein RCCGEPOP_05267 [Rhizobium sp. Pop5]|nr:hypothetical protein RCCGEPOP_05267 [Rhizobium sp. Pop5]
MMSIYLQYNLALAVILLVFGIQLAWWMPRGWLVGVAGFFASVAGAVTVAAIAIVVMLLVKGGAFAPGLGTVAWAYETGPEFAGLPILLCPIAFVIGRVKRR